MFVCRWWLELNLDIIYQPPYQPPDTRLIVYNPRYEAWLHRNEKHYSISKWREERDRSLYTLNPRIISGREGLSDVDILLPVADMEILHAVR